MPYFASHTAWERRHPCLWALANQPCRKQARMPALPGGMAHETLVRRRLDNRRRLILHAFFQDRGREFRFIRRIGKMLCLEAEAVASVVSLPSLALHLRKKIADVKLHAWFGRPDFHD